eukprot:TRINITY_DN5125_c0_g1_i2.p3 TRINITY_DN5125_c0_g1~~TRINITY_DN5125_c0_g1_i2.p3  ORF type:complete len:118 (-),score=33.92 TRINITY_DN5125_c0_g1_i2:39-392(-)
MVQGPDEKLINCGVFNFNSASMTAMGRGSIAVFHSKALDISYVMLVDRNQPLPKNADEFADLVYMYQDAGLVTITKATNTTSGELVYSSNLHTHDYGKPPQDVWVKLDPGFVIQKEE